MRIWKKRMPRLGRITGTQRERLAKNISLKTFFSFQKPSFYKIGREIIASARRPVEGANLAEAYIVKLNKKSGAFEYFARCSLLWGPVVPERVYLSGAGARASGLNIFRIMLNEAIGFAKEKKCKKVALRSEDRASRAAFESLKSYYERFSFEFNNPKDPTLGVFEFK